MLNYYKLVYGDGKDDWDIISTELEISMVSEAINSLQDEEFYGIDDIVDYLQRHGDVNTKTINFDELEI